MLTTDQVKFDFALSTNVFNSISEREQEFDRWLAKVRAEAWDEGYNTPNYSDLDERYGRPEPRNPYREETK